MTRARLLALACAIAFAAAPAHAGAWTKGFGQHFVRLSVEYFQAGSYQDSRDDAAFGGATGYNAISTVLYGEVGVSPWHPLQLSASIPVTAGTLEFEVADAMEEGSPGRATTLRFGDARLGVQSPVWDLGFQLALAAELKVPLYANDDVGKEYPNYLDVFPLPGDGQLDLTTGLLAGWAPWSFLFFEAALGWMQRTEAFIGYTSTARFGDGVAGRGKVGFIWGPLIGMLEADGFYALEQTPFTRQWLRVAPTVMWTLWEGLAVDVRLAGDVLALNAPQGWAAGVGLSWRMQ